MGVITHLTTMIETDKGSLGVAGVIEINMLHDGVTHRVKIKHQTVIG